MNWKDYVRESVYSLNFVKPKRWRARLQLTRALQLAHEINMPLGVIRSLWISYIKKIFDMTRQEAQDFNYFFDEVLACVRLELIGIAWASDEYEIYLSQVKKECENED